MAARARPAAARRRWPTWASFVAGTSGKTGKPERTIRRVTRPKALGPDLDRVAGTSLDKGAELDALAAMPADAKRAADPARCRLP